MQIRVLRQSEKSFGDSEAFLLFCVPLILLKLHPSMYKSTPSGKPCATLGRSLNILHLFFLFPRECKKRRPLPFVILSGAEGEVEESSLKGSWIGFSNILYKK